MRGHDYRTADGFRRERHRADDLLEGQLRRHADREHGAEFLATDNERERAGRDVSMQYTRQPDVPHHVRLERVETQVDRRRRSGADAQPVGSAENIFEEQPDDREGGEVRPQMSEAQMNEMARNEPPILAALDRVALVTSELARLV